ncbi:type I-E CRISPR-associated protein Cse2/CasB [Streptomyces sp. NPDC047999]|uniref:type I-E CRISPR-associated protein Cse2/CasB n=1 Tax=Streptomyces sp. NPDC047999 TaxID=3365497 RepID=UPI003716FD6D
MTHQSPAQERPASPRERYAAFTRRIERLCADDPGARTALRTGLRRDLDDVPRMHRFVVPELPRGGRIPVAHQRAYYAVASMIAAQPRHAFAAADAEPTADARETPGAEDTAPAPTPQQKYGISLGHAFANAVAKSPARDKAMRESAAESRLNLLTRQSTNGLHRHLPAAVRYLSDVGVDVDWPRLLGDLITWPTDAKKTARHWLQDYYIHHTRSTDKNAGDVDEDETAQQLVRD